MMNVEDFELINKDGKMIFQFHVNLFILTGTGKTKNIQM